MDTAYDHRRPLDNAVQSRSATRSKVRLLHLRKETLTPDFLAFAGILEIGMLIWLLKSLPRRLDGGLFQHRSVERC